MIIGEIGNRGPLKILIWDIGNIVMIFGYIGLQKEDTNKIKVDNILQLLGASYKKKKIKT